MTHLRQIMLEELERRNYAPGTIRCYIRTVEHFSRHFHRSPDQLGPEHIRRYQAVMFHKWKLAPNTVSQRLAALRFFYIQVLKKNWSVAETPYPKKVLHLPQVLSQQEVARLIDAALTPFHRILLMTLYATGGRRAEVARLKISDIDSQRMVVHIRGGKGRKDRDVMLSPPLLDALRVYWRGLQRKPSHWLFPGGRRHTSDRPIDTKVLWWGLPACGPTRRSNAQAHPSTHPAPLLCHSSAGSRRRPAHHSDATRPPRPGRDDDLSASLATASQRNRQSAGRSHAGHTRRTDAERMNRPPLEMADIVRFAGQSFLQRSQRWINWQHQKVLLAITRCRTAALGGHRDCCSGCGHTAISYNSCRNRHCPKCQGNARQRWLQARERELLPTPYVHIVFTLPREVASLALQNKQVIYNLLFQASAETLLEIARDPRHLGAEIGFFSVLHTWNQRLQHHPHIHCVLAAGGLAPDHSRWISSHPSFFLPTKVLSRVFRGKLVAGLRTAFREDRLQFHGTLTPLAEPRTFTSWLRLLFRHDWVVYSKRPFGGPEHALRYLGAYTHRVAVSNHRLVALTDHDVTFRWRDSAHGKKKRLMTLSVDEFLRRFLLHLLPRGFVRIRNFGFLANRQRAPLLPLCFNLLRSSDSSSAAASPATDRDHPCWNCPVCGATMHVLERLSAAQLLLRSPPPDGHAA